jgi:polysaccharide pyruvyl transferase WcaK-like protein
MKEDRPLFILAGNGPYENRGCEAIVKGTVKILQEHFKDPSFICLSHFDSEEQFRNQCSKEKDDKIIHLSSRRLNKKKAIQGFWKPETWSMLYKYFFDRNAIYTNAYKDIVPYFENAISVLSVGGDNYSLDVRSDINSLHYGVPILFTELDNLVIRYSKPIVLWGASVGPFSAIPDYERYMSDHLKKVTGIFAREPATVEYLEGIGVTNNVYRVADPAFIMDPIKPDRSIIIEDGSIGLNLSPLMATFVACGDMERWTKIAAKIIARVAEWNESRLYLIPHVTVPHNNDYAFMERALSLVPEKIKKITLLPPVFDAEETKWIISRMSIFAGARMHATIAAIASCVPTISFSYSMKSQGINQDIFGHTDYCIRPNELLDVERVISRATSMVDESNNIIKKLKRRIPEIKKAAQNAGLILKQLTKADE